MSTMTTAQALNSLWDELDKSIPEHALVQIFITASRVAMEDGICVKEPTNA